MTPKKFSDIASFISDEERQAFRDALSTVTPLHTQFLNISEKPAVKKQIRITRNISEKKHAIQIKNKITSVDSEAVIGYAKTGLQHKRIAQLKQGKIRTNATLDLHGYTADEALRATDDFLLRCQQRNFVAACIIHGKGRCSVDQKPVLKNLLNHYLREHPAVLAFHSAKNNQGGAGAVMVLLRKSA